MRDVSTFEFGNVADTCSVWNVLSSPVLHRAANTAHCEFVVTGFVLYECLYKERSNPTASDTELMRRLNEERRKGRFSDVQLSLSDLQDFAALEQRKRLGHGELSSIAFCRRVQTAFLSDDRGAQNLADQILAKGRVQTTPHLLGWLVWSRRLNDSDVDTVVAEHEEMGQPLGPFLRTMQREALRVRLMTDAQR